MKIKLHKLKSELEENQDDVSKEYEEEIGKIKEEVIHEKEQYA